MHIRPALVLAAGLVTALAATRLFAQDEAAQPPAPGAVAEPAAEAKAKNEKILRLLRATGVEAASKQAMDGMLDQFAKMPSLPPGFVEKFRARANVKDLVELNIPIYAKHLDDATIDAAIGFFESEQGRKLIAKQPAMMQEAMAAGGAYGTRIATEVLAEMQEGQGGK